MKVKIAAALKTEYANLGLGQKAFDGVADWLIATKTIEKEEDISTAIKGDNVKNLLKSIQSDSDSARTARRTAEEAKLAAEKALEDYKKLHPETTPPAEDDPLKKEIEALKAKQLEYENKLKESEESNRRNSVLDELHRLLKEKGADNDFIRNMTLKGIEIGESDTAESLVEKYKSEYDKNFKEAYGDGPVPRAGDPKPTDYKNGDYKSEVERLRAEGKLPKAE